MNYEPCLEQPEEASLERDEWSPEIGYDPTDVVTEEEAEAQGFLWSCVNSVIEASKAGTLSFEDRARLVEEFTEILF